jgi:hypothetical protein
MEYHRQNSLLQWFRLHPSIGTELLSLFLKINSLEKLVKHMRDALLPHNHTQAMHQPSQSWTHGSRSVNGYMEKPCKEKMHVKMTEPKYQSVSRYNRGMCRQFQTTCTMRGKVVKLVIDPRSSNSVVSDEVV